MIVLFSFPAIVDLPLGRDEKHLSPADSAGLALAAIQGVDERLDREVDALRAVLELLVVENRELRERLEALDASREE